MIDGIPNRPKPIFIGHYWLGWEMDGEVEDTVNN